MSEPGPSQQHAAAQDVPSSTVVTVEETDEQDSETDVPTLTLRLRKPRNDKKVKWTNETVDNEGMNKKKSKCCCIYHKPRKFGESSSSSSDSDDECEHCKGHIEKKKHRHGNPKGTPDTTQPNDNSTPNIPADNPTPAGNPAPDSSTPSN